MKEEEIDFRNKNIARQTGRLYISIDEAAKNNNISRTRVYQLLRSDCIKGCYRVSGTWIIPLKWKYNRKRKVTNRVEFALSDPSKRKV